ncbi:LON peptidase substrate-binding domain-containing protein [Alkalilimnicola ehrlichii MLHE-1]|uniref:Peptidase S16, lon domain protein n=1 Tax=Alkalilimnicola ehrlichii (strain ATCC BAA-1101 / DSM 17681 / MLHE-1) TaxID=187272 RepID=Q0AB31_ALKEH|nr:LON peptidase substrate-binding domain-containing protein [Alkalilimnicola ehrlichii]ABI55956.1 peptidase S16, lon domain protein [Alkalilimnicola ehrlichii MLHE-1]
MSTLLPLFPLQTVLFPGGPLVLRLFEPRYLDMVARCLREDRGFGVCRIVDGRETGAPAIPDPVGTLARIIDWEKRSDGLLGITVRGERRFRIVSRHVERDGLQQAEVEWLPQPPPRPIPPVHGPLAALLERILQQVRGPWAELPRDFDDAEWVSCRLAELLPIPPEDRQQLLELDDPVERLAVLHNALRQTETAED